MTCGASTDDVVGATGSVAIDLSAPAGKGPMALRRVNVARAEPGDEVTLSPTSWDDLGRGPGKLKQRGRDGKERESPMQ